MTQDQKASLRNLTDAELEKTLTAASKKTNWREDLKITAKNVGGGVFIGWCIAAALAPGYSIFWMSLYGLTGLARACGVMEAADRNFNIGKDEEIERLQKEKKRRERAAAPLPAAAPATAIAPPGAMTQDFNSGSISVLKPITLKKPAAAATLTMATLTMTGCE
jgi:hypothetical protein